MPRLRKIPKASSRPPVRTSAPTPTSTARAASLRAALELSVASRSSLACSRAEPVPDRVDPDDAFARGDRRARHLGTDARDRDQRQAVLAHVVADQRRELADVAELHRLVGDCRLERDERRREVPPRRAPRAEEALVVADHEGAQAHLELVDDALEAERGRGHVLRARLLVGRASQVGHREQEQGERRRDEQRDQHAADDESARQRHGGCRAPQPLRDPPARPRGWAHPTRAAGLSHAPRAAPRRAMQAPPARTACR